MKPIRTGSIVLALLGSAGLAMTGAAQAEPGGSLVLAQAIHPGAGSARGTTPGTTADQQQEQTGSISLNEAQRQMIFSRVVDAPQPAPSGFSLRVGATLPPDVVLQPVPQAVVSEIPQVEPYHYAMFGGRIVFVEPSSRRVVTVLER